MKAIVTQAHATYQQMSMSAKYLLAVVLAMLVCVTTASISTDYTRRAYVNATVVAKTQTTPVHKGNWTPKFIIALRHPDGTLQDVYTSYSRYATTEVGSKWGVMYSDFDRGRPVPTTDKVRFSILFISLACAVLAFASLTAHWLFPPID